MCEQWMTEFLPKYFGSCVRKFRWRNYQTELVFRINSAILLCVMVLNTQATPKLGICNGDLILSCVGPRCELSKTSSLGWCLTHLSSPRSPSLRCCVGSKEGCVPWDVCHKSAFKRTLGHLGRSHARVPASPRPISAVLTLCGNCACGCKAHRWGMPLPDSPYLVIFKHNHGRYGLLGNFRAFPYLLPYPPRQMTFGTLTGNPWRAPRALTGTFLCWIISRVWYEPLPTLRNWRGALAFQWNCLRGSCNLLVRALGRLPKKIVIEWLLGPKRIHAQNKYWRVKLKFGTHKSRKINSEGTYCAILVFFRVVLFLLFRCPHARSFWEFGPLLNQSPRHCLS